jgi:glutathione S-transferase
MFIFLPPFVHSIQLADYSRKYLFRHTFAQFGQVPALKHGDFVVFESRAIARYLDNIATSGKHLVPKDVKKAALVEQWLSVDHDNIQPNLKGVVAEKYHWYGPNENAEAIKAAQVKLENVFNVLDAHFAKNQWFIGDEVTLAGPCFKSFFSIIFSCCLTFLKYLPHECVDLSPLAYIELYYLLGGEYAAAIDSRPNLSSWWKRARALPAWQAASPSQN